MSYDPAIHHRQSIRLKGHDYAGGGMYFVTICAHRAAGNIFAPPPVKAMIAREWESAAASVGADQQGRHKACPYMAAAPASVGAGLVSALSPEHNVCPEASPMSAQACEGRHKACPYVIMPDHFHALIRLPAGEKSLGDVICAFKSRVMHEYIAGVKQGQFRRFPGNLWHRNYYEMIVRDAEAEENIGRYIRLNPWRCVMAFEGGLRGIGNPTLWHARKMGVLASRGGMPGDVALPAAADDAVWFGGFHSPAERAVFDRLLAEHRPVIWCPAWGLGGVGAGLVSALPGTDTRPAPARADTRPAPTILTALEQNRLLILEMTEHDGTLASAAARNRFVLEQADTLWLPHVTPGGMIDRLVKEMRVQEKVLNYAMP